MLRCRSPFTCMAILVGIVFLGLPPPTTRADFQLQIYDDGVPYGGNPIKLTGPIAGFNNINTGDFIIGGTATALAGGSLTLNNISIVETSGASHTLTLVLSATGFTNPAGPAGTMSSSISYTATDAVAGGQVTYQGYFDSTNTIFGTGGTSTGLQSLTVGNSAGTTQGSDGPATTGVGISGPYSLTSVTNITFNDQGAEADNQFVSIQTTGTTNVTGAVTTPAPGIVILAGSAFPMLIGGWFLRRRKQAQLA